MLKNVYEILKEIESVETDQQRKQILEQNNNYYFIQVLRYAFDPAYQFYIEDFPAEYIKPDTAPGIRFAGIESEIRRAYLFLKGDPTADSLSEEKRKVLLLQLLESFEPQEAVVFVNMMNKDLKTLGLTETLVRETFPTLLPTT
jgi:hypothetical protein